MILAYLQITFTKSFKKKQYFANKVKGITRIDNSNRPLS